MNTFWKCFYEKTFFVFFRDASMLQHSCISNANKHFEENGKIIVRAAVTIKKGQSVTINYSDPMWGTASRQQHLKQTKYFVCDCLRCKDPKVFILNVLSYLKIWLYCYIVSTSTVAVSYWLLRHVIMGLYLGAHFQLCFLFNHQLGTHHTHNYL